MGHRDRWRHVNKRRVGHSITVQLIDIISDNVYIAPSGVQKERMLPEDMFVLRYNTSEIISKPDNPSYRMSQCTPLFWKCYSLRPTTMACIHSHSINAVLATLICGDDASTIELTHLEMIKGIKKGETGESMNYFDKLVIPIIENTAQERDLAESMANAIMKYPDTNAILVRRHGVYVWGDSWERCKTMAETYDYLFECFVKMKQLGLDPSVKPQNSMY
jgi:methylthioribulose-1-phosphate dehydratase